MKIERKEVEVFNPVVLTFETEVEYLNFRYLIDASIDKNIFLRHTITAVLIKNLLGKLCVV